MRLKTPSLRFPLRAGGTEPLRGSPREAVGTCRRGGSVKGMTPVVAIADCKVSNGNSTVSIGDGTVSDGVGTVSIGVGTVSIDDGTVSIDEDTPTRNGGK